MSFIRGWKNIKEVSKETIEHLEKFIEINKLSWLVETSKLNQNIAFVCSYKIGNDGVPFEVGVLSIDLLTQDDISKIQEAYEKELGIWESDDSFAPDVYVGIIEDSTSGKEQLIKITKGEVIVNEFKINNEYQRWKEVDPELVGEEGKGEDDDSLAEEDEDDDFIAGAAFMADV